MNKFLLLIIAFIASSAQSSECDNTFIDGLTSHYLYGRIEFGEGALLVGDPDSILANQRALFNDCQVSGCLSNERQVPAIELAVFPTEFGIENLNIRRKSSNTISVTFNHYASIIIGEQANLYVSPNFDEHYIQYLSVKNQAVLNLRAGDYFIERLKIASDVSINVIGAGTVRIFSNSTDKLMGNLKMNANGAEDSAQLFFYSADDIVIGERALINGFLYSQNGVTLNRGSTLTGAVSAKTVILKENVTVRYDEDALDEIDFKGICN